MLEVVTGSVDLQRRLDARQGYLANRKIDGRTYTVHDLGHFCNAPVEFTPEDYPKIWAGDTHEFTEAWGVDGWTECGNCRSKRQAGR